MKIQKFVRYPEKTGMPKRPSSFKKFVDWFDRTFIKKGVEYNMSKENCSVIINGREFVSKDLIEKAQDLEGMPYQIVRTYSAGVFAGYVESHNGQEVTIRKARRLWYWDGAASLSQLAEEGVKKPENCKFPCEVEKMVVLQAIELIDCTEMARISIQAVKKWQV